jgi:rubrerythrin
MTEDKPATMTALLEQAWLGEWYGVQVYGALADAREDRTEREMLRELTAMESFVLGEVTVALAALGDEVDPVNVAYEAEADIASHAHDEWHDLLRWIRADAEIALTKYRPLPELTAHDPDLARLADLVCNHERALIAFTERAQAGEEDALSDVRALMQAGDER